MNNSLHVPCHPYFKLRKRIPGIKADFKLRKEPAGIKPAAAPAPATWNVPDLCAAYKWPSSLPGGGIIAIVELGGGWVQSDINSFFKSLNQPVPQITDISVDGTQNSPGKGDADIEVALDIEVAGAAYFAATGHAATIRMYWAQDIATAVQKAADDGCDVCSISWGADEAVWGKAAAKQMESAAAAATAAGMAVFAASGDNDAGDGGSSPANVDVPASCPHIVGCGGTHKTSAAETVWNNTPGNPSGEGTGGGYSTIFPAQAFQIGAPPAPPDSKYGKGRMVPDVAADADPDTGYNIFVQGSENVVGGTSAVAPLYSGLFAAFGRKPGFVTPTLWQNPSAFTDVISGDNGIYHAAPGPDPCTGLGAPIGSSIAGLFVKEAVAGGHTHGGHHRGGHKS